MSPRTFLTSFVVVAALLALHPEFASAQCAMCRAALEQNGGQVAAGFNRGILFLLGMPYLVFGSDRSVVGLETEKGRGRGRLPVTEKPFLSDIKTLRERARRHIEKGACHRRLRCRSRNGYSHFERSAGD